MKSFKIEQEINQEITGKNVFLSVISKGTQRCNKGFPVYENFSALGAKFKMASM